MGVSYKDYLAINERFDSQAGQGNPGQTSLAGHVPFHACFRGTCYDKGLSTREAGRGHATPHMPVETAKCWWLLKIEPNAWAGGKGSCAVCVDLQTVGTLKFFGELYSLAKGFGPF